MGPMADGGTRVDIADVPRLPRASVPIWLLVVMGMSGLFDQWAVRVAGTLTWFYNNHDGEFGIGPSASMLRPR